MRRLPVDSRELEHELVGERVEPHELDEAVDLRVDVALRGARRG
jgi:hypothetical protein